MSNMQGSAPEPGTIKTPSGGRPRSEASRLSLLESAYALMKKQPVNEISTQAIAHKAGVSTATVYRWWPTKEALLLDAVLHVKEQKVLFPEEGTPLERIRSHMISAGKFFGGDDGRVAARIIAAIQDDDHLREGFIEKLYLPQANRLLEVGQDAVNAGELPSGTNVKLLMDTIFGTCLVRILIRHEKVEQEDVAAAFDFAVAGARAYWPKRSKRRISPPSGRRKSRN